MTSMETRRGAVCKTPLRYIEFVTTKAIIRIYDCFYTLRLTESFWKNFVFIFPTTDYDGRHKKKTKLKLLNLVR